MEIVAGDSFSNVINVTSFLSTNAITLFGALAVIALACMYIIVLVQRRTVRVTEGAN